MGKSFIAKVASLSQKNVSNQPKKIRFFAEVIVLLAKFSKFEK
jgi:hypothetical protein